MLNSFFAMVHSLHGNKPQLFSNDGVHRLCVHGPGTGVGGVFAWCRCCLCFRNCMLCVTVVQSTAVVQWALGPAANCAAAHMPS